MNSVDYLFSTVPLKFNGVFIELPDIHFDSTAKKLEDSFGKPTLSSVAKHEWNLEEVVIDIERYAKKIVEAK